MVRKSLYRDLHEKWYHNAVRVEMNLEVEQEVDLFRQEVTSWRIYFSWPKNNWEFLSKHSFHFASWICVRVCNVCVCVCVCVCCGLSHLCGIGRWRDEGLIDRGCDWKCNPPLPLSLSVSPCHRPQSGLLQQGGHSTRPRGWNVPVSCWLQDALMVVM